MEAFLTIEVARVLLINVDISLFSVVIIHTGKDCTLVVLLHVKLQDLREVTFRAFGIEMVCK